jgi:2-oxoisovalerate dehydrogenase E1 component alpha subunit
VTNNGYGISTPARTQHSEMRISDRGEVFGIPGETVDGNDVVAVWHAIERGLDYCRRLRKPYLLEARVSRLHGHSSSSGAARVANEADCLKSFEKQLIAAGVIHRELAEMVHHEAHEEADRAVEIAMSEERPTAADVERFTFAPSPVDAVYPNDYTGLPK